MPLFERVLSRYPAYNKALMPLVYLLLLAWFIHLLLTIFLTPAPASVVTDDTGVQAVRQQKAAAQAANPAAIAKWELFGAYQGGADQTRKAPRLTEQEANARETRLKLVLSGIAAATAQEEAYAVIGYQNEQATYRVGDKLPVGQRVTVSKVLADRIIINNNGNYESLILYEQGTGLAEISEPADEVAPPAIGLKKRGFLKRRTN
jgi:general secretion pathway protein C